MLPPERWFSRFGLPAAKVSAVCDRLTRRGLVQRRNGFRFGALRAAARAREHELRTDAVDLDHVARREFTGEHLLREHVLDVLLDGALQRAGAELRVPAELAEQILRGVAHLERELAFGE